MQLVVLALVKPVQQKLLIHVSGGARQIAARLRTIRILQGTMHLVISCVANPCPHNLQSAADLLPVCDMSTSAETHLSAPAGR